MGCSLWGLGGVGLGWVACSGTDRSFGNGSPSPGGASDDGGPGETPSQAGSPEDTVEVTVSVGEQALATEPCRALDSGSHLTTNCPNPAPGRYD